MITVHLLPPTVTFCRLRRGHAGDHTPVNSVKVTLFKPSGKYYTTEKWRVPDRAIGPYDMIRSPNFRRIDGGAVYVNSQEPWGYPHLFPSEIDHNGGTT